MTFRKNALLFVELEFFCIMMALFSLSVTSLLGRVGSSLLFLLFVLLVLVIPNILNEFITIDEIGISCRQNGILRWAYNWEQIADIRESSRFRMPSIEIVLYSESGLPEKYAKPSHYFQLGKVAKRALKQFNG